MQTKNNNSPMAKAVQRLRKNKPALFGIIVIGIACFLAIFAYVLVPDATPNGNNQIPQIALKNPGFSCQILAVRKNIPVQKRNIISRLWQGESSVYKLLPIENYQILGDSIFAKEYADAEDYSVPIYHRLHLLDVVYPLALTQKNIEKKDKDYVFQNVDNELIRVVESDVVKVIEQEQMYTQTFYLGTDRFGRDMLSRLIIGVRISLLVGLIAVVISLTIGILLGAIAGYFGGRVDTVISFLINTVWSIPTLLLVFAIVLALGKSIVNIFIAVGLTMWVDVARIVRGQVLAYKEILFVEAARSMGFQTPRILMRHILPNILGPVMVIASANFATAILIEAGLSYLGFGIQPPTPSWGTMLNENYGYAISGKVSLALVPALAIALLVLAFNLLGNGIRDALDVKGIS